MGGQVGKGVRALTEFVAGEVIAEYTGECLRRKEAEVREREYLKMGFYDCYMFFFSILGTGYCIDATQDDGSIGRLINHPFTADGVNCVCKIIETQPPKLYIIADRYIEPGEQIAYEYGDNRKKQKVAFPFLKVKKSKAKKRKQ